MHSNNWKSKINTLKSWKKHLISIQHLNSKHTLISQVRTIVSREHKINFLDINLNAQFAKKISLVQQRVINLFIRDVWWSDTRVSWPYIPISVGTCDIESLVTSGHKEIWRPPPANMGFYDYKDVVAFGNNQLWWPPVKKFRLWLRENDYVICEQTL